MNDTERIAAIEKIIEDLKPTAPPDEWHTKWKDAVEHFARLPPPLAARYVAKAAKKFDVPKKDLADDVKKERRKLAVAVAPPPAYKPDAHPAIGATEGGDFWIAAAKPSPAAALLVAAILPEGYPTAPYVWHGLTSSGEERIGPMEPANLAGVAQMFEGRWSDESRESFSTNVNVPSLATTYGRVKALVERYVEFRKEQREPLATVVALWIVGTYFHPIFGVYGYLAIEGGKGSGKSRLLELLAALCFNGCLSPDMTAAVLCRLTAGAHATLCLDEVEHLLRQSEDTATIRRLLNAGYKKGGQVARVSREGGIDRYDAFSPKALAGIAGLNDVTSDRAIRIPMLRATDESKCKLSIDANADDIAEARDWLYETALASQEEVRGAYVGIKLPREIVNRSYELWRPLFAIASVIDTGANSRLVAALTPLAVEDSKERSELDPISTAVGDALWFRANANSGSVARKIRPLGVAEEASNVTGHKVSPEWVGRFLRRHGFKKTGHDADGNYYCLDPLRLYAELQRIGWRPPEGGPLAPPVNSAAAPTTESGDGPDGSEGYDGRTTNTASTAAHLNGGQGDDLPL